MNKKDLLHKPNQTIAITGNEISTTQRKAYNVVLFEARKQVKANKNQILFNYSIAELKKKAGIESTNNTQLKTALEGLKNISVDTVFSNDDWLSFNLIAQYKKVGDLLEIQLPEVVRQAIIKNDHYTTLDLLTIKNLNGKHSVILYELAMRYHKKSIPVLTVEKFRELTGTNEYTNEKGKLKNKSYNNFGVLKKLVIEKAIEEINQKTDIIMSYEPYPNINGMKVQTIKFKVKLKQQEEPQIKEIKTVKTIENKEVEKLLILCKQQTEKVEQILANSIEIYDLEYLESNIEYTNLKAKDNYAGYLKKAIVNDYAEQVRFKQSEAKIKQEKKQEELQALEEAKADFEAYLDNYINEQFTNLEDYIYKDLKAKYKSDKILQKTNPTLDGFIKMTLKQELMADIEMRCEPNNYNEYIDFINYKRHTDDIM